MVETTPKKTNRRSLLAGAAAGAGVVAGGYWIGSVRRVSRAAGKKVIVIGIDGMDPLLSEAMMNEGQLPHLAKIRAAGGFSPLGTSIPPQSPVAWANFINGAGPGSHGIFDFIHRHPHEQCTPFFSVAETLPGEGGLRIGDHTLQLDFWPINHKPPATVLRRQGVPFWDYLDAAGIPSTFYDLPSNYPPSPSRHGNHRCISGMGTPDMLGTYGTYQFFSENNPPEPLDEGGGKHFPLVFERETARGRIVGPDNTFLTKPKPTGVDFLIHRDRAANAAVIEVQGDRIVLRAGQWSGWKRLDFELTAPAMLPHRHVSGICRFYLQEAAPHLRLYVSPINVDPSTPAVPLSEPASFVQDVAGRIGPFYTTGFQEDHKARTNNVFDDDEYLKQAGLVLEERLTLLEYALHDYDDGLLFFYFSSSDLQSHMFWWTPDEEHPTRPAQEAAKFFDHIKLLYRKLDAVIGDLHDRYGSRATMIVMSDHGFANFGRQFNLNSWLRESGYLQPRECTSILRDADWSKTIAYGLGINGLYLNLKGRERDGIVEPGAQADALLKEIAERLEATRDIDRRPVIRTAYRADRIYSGEATGLSPDLVIGYRRGFRASWATCLGELTDDVLLDNDSAWTADHCADALEVPGVLWCNHPLRRTNPALVDIAPSILAEYGLNPPPTMTGRSVFAG